MVKLDSKKVVTWEHLEAMRQRWKEDNRVVVFTNGVFDILHAGHVYYLQQAREMGDLLIVGLNSDASVRRYKGSDRPLQSEEDRAFVLAGLESVDYVTLFEQDTPGELIDRLIPDVLVKGGDYNPDDIVGAKTVRSNGGSVQVIPFVTGRATSNILDKYVRSRDRNFSESP